MESRDVVQERSTKDGFQERSTKRWRTRDGVQEIEYRVIRMSEEDEKGTVIEERGTDGNKEVERI